MATSYSATRNCSRAGAFAADTPWTGSDSSRRYSTHAGHLEKALDFARVDLDCEHLRDAMKGTVLFREAARAQGKVRGGPSAVDGKKPARIKKLVAPGDRTTAEIAAMMECLRRRSTASY